ncbi:MAG: KAP family NTPase [Thermodesulfobacteriota bacterium]
MNKERWSRKITGYTRPEGGEDHGQSSPAVRLVHNFPISAGTPALEPSCILSPDKPLTDPRDDQLGYAPFARHLALSLARMMPADGFVVAIYGPWGSGKTTLLNFIFHYFQQASPDEQPIIVPFNPWWFSGHEQLTKHFFDQLQASLLASDIVKGSLVEKISEFASMVSELPPSIHIPYISIGKIAVEFTPMKPAVKNVVKLKIGIAEELRKQPRRIFVTVDDIDRLNPQEIRQLFGLIKSIADFPNIVYLLTFDKRVVIEALRESQGISGENYLEKIVQSPFELPQPDQSSLYRLLLDKLEIIMAGTPEGLFDPSYWSGVFMKGIEPFISTPRKINLLTNTLSVTYAAVRGEVNPVDFIGIETLRIFSPEAFQMIRTYPEKFTGRELMSSKIDQLRAFHESWITQVAEEDREAVKALLSRLFPKLENVWENLGFDRPLEALWRKQLRICSPEIFPIYFQLALPPGTISHGEIRAILSQVDNSQAFSARLLGLASQVRPDGCTRLRAFLDRLLDYADTEISLESIPTIFFSLFDVGDQFIRPEDESFGNLPIGNEHRLTQIILQLLRRLPWESRFHALREAITHGRAVFTCVRNITELGKIAEKYADDDRSKVMPLIRHSDQVKLEELALAKIRGAARDGSLLKSPKLPELLTMWKGLGGDAEPKNWVNKLMVDDHNLLDLLENFLERESSHSMLKVEGGPLCRLNHRSLESYLEPARLVDRVRTLSENRRLSQSQKLALHQFLEIYEVKGSIKC